MLQKTSLCLSLKNSHIGVWLHKYEYKSMKMCFYIIHRLKYQSLQAKNFLGQTHVWVASCQLSGFPWIPLEVGLELYWTSAKTSENGTWNCSISFRRFQKQHNLKHFVLKDTNLTQKIISENPQRQCFTCASCSFFKSGGALLGDSRTQRAQIRENTNKLKIITKINIFILTFLYTSHVIPILNGNFIAEFKKKEPMFAMIP